MYKLEFKDYPKVGEVVAICNVDEPRRVRAIVAVAGKGGWFNYAIDCGQMFDLNNDGHDGTIFVDYQFELDGKIGWRHASREEFDEMVDLVTKESENNEELIYVVDRRKMRLYTFTDREDYTEWLKTQNALYNIHLCK